MQPRVFVSQLEPGDLFDDSRPTETPARESVYRVIGVRSKTVLAENVVGIRRSFTKGHEVARATRELWDRLVATPAPAAPAAQPGEGDRTEVA